MNVSRRVVPEPDDRRVALPPLCDQLSNAARAAAALTASPSRLPDLGRLAVPTRPVVAGAAPTPLGLHLQAPGCPQLHQAAAATQRGRTPTSPRTSSASWRTGVRRPDLLPMRLRERGEREDFGFGFVHERADLRE